MLEVKQTLQTWGWQRPAGIGERPDSRIEVVNL
jgi:electron transport complex protein RnfB